MTRLPASVRCLLLACGLAAPSAAAQPVDILTYTPPRVHDGQSVVRVTADSAREVQAALALAESLWSEGAGVGSFDIQIRTERLPVLVEAGLGVEVRIADLQAHADRGWAQVQAAERAIRARDAQPRPRGAGPHDETWFENYKQLADIEAYVNALHAARPDLSTQSIAGQSLQNRPIRVITITGQDQPGNAAADRPVILFNGCQHAREWISPMTVTYIASRLIADYDIDPAVKSVVDSVRFVIVPVANPDGYIYTWSGERFWRKNRRLNPSGDFGVDLNRNWGFEWGGDGASSNTSSDTYRGASPFSEPETQFLRDLALSYGDDLAAHIDYHTYSQLILYPFGFADGVQAPEPDRTFFDTLSTDMSDLIMASSGMFYDPIPSWALYPASGTASDWFYGSADAKSLTIELRPSAQTGGLAGFDPPPSTILPTARENFLAAQLFADRTTQALSFSATPPATVVVGEPTEVGFTVASGLGTLDPATVSAVAGIGDGPLAPALVTPLGGGSYRVTLPPAVCGQPLSFAFSAATTDGRTVNYPQAGPFVADAITVLFEDDMESDTGWTIGAPSDTATTGLWSRAEPQATDAQPGSDASPDGTLCWITGPQAGSGVGSFDVDGGSTTLTSPRLDATGDQTDLVYSRWYSNDAGASPNTDTMPVQISDDDGVTWTSLETVSENANAWVERRFRVADFVTPTDRVRVRFIARDDAPGSIVEAGVDDLRLVTAACDTPATADLAAPFGEFNLFDILAFLDLYNAQNPAADFDANGGINFFDVTAYLGLFNAGV